MNKQHILDEIARTAVLNGGIVPGRERFFQKTGIKESDWLVKFWARWGDAVREVGFVPSKLTAPLEETALLESYVAVIREFGHLPVVSELKLKTRQTSGFPSHNTFRKFGNKAQQINKLIEYCENKPSYADVLEIARASEPADAEVPTEANSRDETIGFVYLLKANRYFKIGRSNSFDRRSRKLAIQLPERAETVHVIRTDDPIGIELYWHRRFESKRKNGEWFELDTQDVKVFRRRKFM
ncbi:MAG: GIY-YIG nuclease family protein [Polaromonas sp.]